MDSKDAILSDAICTAIEYSKKSIKLRKLLAWSMALNLVFFAIIVLLIL